MATFEKTPPTVEVFKTDVSSQQKAQKTLETLAEAFPQIKFNFDLDDCDHILRAEGAAVPVDEILKTLQIAGAKSSVLD